MKKNSYQKDLDAQVDKIFREANSGSFKTREKYHDACHRFTEFLSEEFKLRKFSNISDKHITAFVSCLRDHNVCDNTIRSYLSGVRFCHNHCDRTRNVLSSNRELGINLQSRTRNKNRAWTENEYRKALKCAEKHPDIRHALVLCRELGLRIEEAINVKLFQITPGMDHIDVKGKGGLVRTIPLDSRQMQILQDLKAFGLKNGKRPSDKIIPRQDTKGSVAKQKSRIENWVANHRADFSDRTGDKYTELVEYSIINGLKTPVSTITVHGLRHSFAQDRLEKLTSELKDERVSKIAVSNMLGHNRIEITNLYTAAR
ncbi:MAG: site-specific integrase [Oscillospiraceae bacterium]|nr:site-specific integrase [Oscillospiraceae bacterium]